MQNKFSASQKIKFHKKNTFPSASTFGKVKARSAFIQYLNFVTIRTDVFGIFFPVWETIWPIQEN